MMPAGPSKRPRKTRLLLLRLPPIRRLLLMQRPLTESTLLRYPSKLLLRLLPALRLKLMLLRLPSRSKNWLRLPLLRRLMHWLIKPLMPQLLELR